MNRAPCLLVLSLLAATGCAHFKSRPIVPAQSAAALESRTLNNPDFQRFLSTNLHREFHEWPAKSWDFDMLMLAALYYHPSLDVARAEWTVATAGEQTAAARPNPSITAAPGYDFSAASGISPWIPGVTFDVPIETAGKRSLRRDQARHLSDAARLRILVAAWKVRSNLRASLLAFAAAQQRAMLSRHSLDVQDALVRSMQQRLQAGAVSKSDLAIASLSRQKTSVDQLDSDIKVIEARAAIAEAIGIPIEALNNIDLPAELGEMSAAELDDTLLRREAMTGRADVLAALADYAAAQSALQLEIAKQYPDIHLGPGYQYDQGDHKFTLSFTVELPILNQNQGPIAEAGARRAAMAARFEELQARVLAETDRAITTFRNLKTHASALAELAGGAAKRVEAIEAEIKAGATDPIDLLNARVELAAGKMAEIEGRIRLQEAVGRLEDALQRPVEAFTPSVLEASPRTSLAKENHP